MDAELPPASPSQAATSLTMMQRLTVLKPFMPTSITAKNPNT